MHDYDFNLPIQLVTREMQYISKSAEKNSGACAPWKFWLGAQIESWGRCAPCAPHIPTPGFL